MVLKGQRECGHLLELFDYFLTALPFAEEQSYRANTYIDEMLAEAESVLADQTGRSEVARQLAQRMLHMRRRSREVGNHQHAEQE